MANARLAARVLVPLLAVACAGCLSLLGLESIAFTEGDAAADGPGADGAADALVDQRAASDAGDASDADAGPSTCYDRHDGGYDGGAILFCDDFERTGAVDQGWKPMSVLGGGTLEISSEASTSGAKSLLVTLPAAGSNKHAYLRTLDLPSGTDLSYFEADVKLDLQPPVTGVFPGDAFTLMQATNISNGFKQAFVRTPAAGMFNPIFFVTDAEFDFTSADWHHLTWVVDPVNQTMTIVKRGTTTGVSRVTNSPQPIRDYWIGAEIEAAGGPVRLFVDDVVVHR
jgi:hypothetical protein